MTTLAIVPRSHAATLTARPIAPRAAGRLTAFIALVRASLAALAEDGQLGPVGEVSTARHAGARA